MQLVMQIHLIGRKYITICPLYILTEQVRYAGNTSCFCMIIISPMGSSILPDICDSEWARFTL